LLKERATNNSENLSGIFFIKNENFINVQHLTNNGDAFSFKGMSSQYEDQKTSFLNITQIKVSYQMIQKIISKNVKHFSKVESSIETVHFRDLMSKWF